MDRKIKKRLSKLMLSSLFVSSFFISIGYPAFYKNITSILTERIISLSTITSCVGSALISKLWNNHSDKLFKYYPLLNIIEGVLNIIVVSFALITGNLLVYYILDMLTASLLTRHLICANIKIKSMCLQGKQRESFDNNACIVDNISILVGSLLSFLLGDYLTIKGSLCLFIFSLVISNMIDFIIFILYKHNK